MTGENKGKEKKEELYGKSSVEKYGINTNRELRIENREQRIENIE